MKTSLCKLFYIMYIALCKLHYTNYIMQCIFLAIFKKECIIWAPNLLKYKISLIVIGQSNISDTKFNWGDAQRK